MFFFAALVFGVLAFGSQAVLSLSFKFELSQVRQCEPVSIKFVGDTQVNPIAMSLTLLPFGSQPIAIPIPNAATNTSGIDITFFPFAAGTKFVASLDDSTGENVAKVSDVVTVLPSPTGNTTCLPSPNVPATTTSLFTTDSNLSQCETFSLAYNRTVISRAPSVRLYCPDGPSFLLNLTSDEPSMGMAKYLLNFEQNREVVLLFNDGRGHQATSLLTTVGGNSSSSEDCLKRRDNGNQNNGSSGVSNTNKQNNPPGISKAVLIGSAAGGGVVFLIFIFMVLFILRERRRRQSGVKSDPALLEKGQQSIPMGDRRPASLKFDTSYGYIKDPPYTAEKFVSPTNSVYPRASMASWAQAIPEDQRYPIKSDKGFDAYGNPKSDDELSLHSLDIEGILNMAAVDSNRSSRQTAEPTPIGPVLQSPTYTSGPFLAVPRPYPARGHLREPSDVPRDPSSYIAFSIHSENPFEDDSEARHSILHSLNERQRSLDSVIRPPPGAVIGLPSSPRNGIRPGKDGGSGIEEIEPTEARSGNPSAKDSADDEYGVAR